jgi:mRNA interferase RelE/StbE
VIAFSPRILKGAARQLRKLDPPVAKRIVRQISWLSQHFDELKPETLKGNLAGLFKYREGDYRIIYEPIPEEKVLVIHEIGHRSEIYKRSKT